MCATKVLFMLVSRCTAGDPSDPQIFPVGKWPALRNHESRESVGGGSFQRGKLSVSISTKSSKFAMSAREMG